MKSPFHITSSKHHPEEEEEEGTDAMYDETDIGSEWPLQENKDVKGYRQFYQSWCGVVQGAHPVEKEVAIKVSI